jgi:hypothetical protein
MSKQYLSLYICLFCLFTITGLAVWILWPDSPEKAEAHNELYLRQIAGMACKFRERHGRVPESIDELLKDGSGTLSHRGDFYGGKLLYQRACNSAFYLRTSNVKLYYANCFSVSKTEFSAWVRSHPDTGENANASLHSIVLKH